MYSVWRLTRLLSGLSPNIQGMLWMAVAGLIFASFMAIVRHVGSTLDPIQVAFLRYGLGLVFMLPFFLRLNIADFQSARFGLHAIRGVLHAGGVMCWFYAMSRIPIAEVTAIGFTAPVFATIGAALFLGEKVRLRRILAVLIGLLGALIIIRPGIVARVGRIVDAYRGATFCNIRSYVKSINTKETGPALVAYLSVFVTLTIMILPYLFGENRA